MAEAIKAHKECDATHAQEKEDQKQAIKTGDPKDPVVHLLDTMHWVAREQANRAVDTFLTKIKEMLRKHIPVGAQGPLIANALSMAMQFQMSIWRMISNKCIRPMHAKHSDWCGLVGIVQAIVKTFRNNCALMFPAAPALPPVPGFSCSTYQPIYSDDDDDNDHNPSTRDASMH